MWDQVKIIFLSGTSMGFSSAHAQVQLSILTTANYYKRPNCVLSLIIICRTNLIYCKVHSFIRQAGWTESTCKLALVIIYITRWQHHSSILYGRKPLDSCSLTPHSTDLINQEIYQRFKGHQEWYIPYNSFWILLLADIYFSKIVCDKSSVERN